MAGSGRKVFTAGDVLTASDVQNYLQDQTVMVFGGTAARSAAIATPTEGMLAVTTDNDQVDYYNGSAWVPALPVGAWESYTPTLTNVTLGNGSIAFAYSQLGKTIQVRGSLGFGSTTSITGSMFISLPVTANTAGGGPVVGTCYLSDTGTALNAGYVRLDTTSRFSFSVIDASSTYARLSIVNATVPYTWTTNDALQFNATYQAA